MSEKDKKKNNLSIGLHLRFAASTPLNKAHLIQTISAEKRPDISAGIGQGGTVR